MKIPENSGTKKLDTIYSEIERLGLEKNTAELEAYGLTVIEPEVAAPKGFANRLRDALLDVATKRTGVKWDLELGVDANSGINPHLHLWWLILEGEVFEQALMNPNVIALVTYLIGENCILSAQSAMLKASSDEHGYTPLHVDNAFQPAPLPAYAQVANASWALTDYTRDNGCLCYVPGSHKNCAPPPNSFADVEFDEAGAVPVEVKAGSLIVWHGNTWHGAYRRKTPGLRVNLINDIRRPYMFPEERYKDMVPEHILKRNSARFSRMLQQEHPFGWTGPEAYEKKLMDNATRNWGTSVFT